MVGIIKAPWTVEQVLNLNHWQRCGRVHPYTCGRCRDELGTHFLLDGPAGTRVRPASDEEWEQATADAKEALEKDDPVAELLGMRRRWTIIDHCLVATVNGWICPTCDYTQDWAHDI
jgi:hypothetical protein